MPRHLHQILLLFLLLIIQPVQASSPPMVDFSDEERAWLDAHPVIRMAVDPDSPPFEGISEQGDYEGISADLMALIGERLGVRFEVVPGRDWAHVLEMARNREADLVPSIVRSEEREAYLNFTRPYLSLPGVIISARQFDNLEALKGQRVAVVAGGIWDERISQYDDEVSIIRVEDTRTGLELTALGGVDAMVSNLATITYLIGMEGITNLQIVARVPKRLDISLGVRNDWPEFLPILEKVLDDIPEEEIETIKNRWIDVAHTGLHLSPMFWYLTLGSLAVLLLLLIGFIAWNRSLKSRVEQRSRELEQAQARLAHAEKMESIGLLALGVAHEVKNPLAILQMGLDFIGGDTDRDETEKTLLKDMNEALNRADTIVQSLQVFSRKKNLSMETGNVNEVLMNALKQYETELEEHQIKLSAELDAELPGLNMDARQLQQGFANIIHNAILAMPEGGSLSVKTSSATLKEGEAACDISGMFEEGESVVRLEISDTGTGIAEACLNKVFDPFFTTRPQGEGTGLGLSLSQNIVKLHNGFIDLRNRETNGISVVMIFKIYKGES